MVWDATPRSALRALGRTAALSHCRFVLPLVHFMPDPLTYSVPLFLKRQWARLAAHWAAAGLAAAYVPLRVAIGAIGRTAALHDRE